MTDKIPVTVIVTTKNEESCIGRCLDALLYFEHVIVVDSQSTDKTCEIARSKGAEVIHYQWDGRYPKKRQWCLDTITISHDWVFWVDADEVVQPELIEEMRALFKGKPQCAGYFIYGQYVWNGRLLKYGLRNNKIALFNRHKMGFPVVEDLDIDGMGEIEGHYQPVLSDENEKFRICQLKNPLLHYAYEDKEGWEERHERYAQWEARMTLRSAWPDDPVAWRQSVKSLLRRSFLRSYVFFILSYILKCGFLDGKDGLWFALSRFYYARRVYSLLCSRDFSQR